MQEENTMPILVELISRLRACGASVEYLVTAFRSRSD